MRTDQGAAHINTNPELAFLEAIGRGDTRAIAALTLGRRLDFDVLREALVHERMGVYVHARLAELGLRALLPRRVAEPIRWQHAEQQQRNGQLLALLDEVQRALADVGIEVLVLKGLPMAQRFWGGMDRRFSFDLDLLVRRDQYRAATAALIRLGFSAPRLVPQPDRLALHVSHALELTRDGLSLDLHWTLRKRPGLHFDLAATWASAASCRLDGIDCRVPSDEDQLVMLLTGLANDLERGHHRLRSFWDIYFMLKGMRRTDWRAFWASRADQGLSVLLLNLLALVLWRLDCADHLPELAAAIADDADRLIPLDPEAARRLLTSAPQSLANRRWFARLLPTPAWRYWAWWGGALPLRFLLGRHI
jgi:hypothetical protein